LRCRPSAIFPAREETATAEFLEEFFVAPAGDCLCGWSIQRSWRGGFGYLGKQIGCGIGLFSDAPNATALFRGIFVAKFERGPPGNHRHATRAPAARPACSGGRSRRIMRRWKSSRPRLSRLSERVVNGICLFTFTPSAWTRPLGNIDYC
jgi:hypothetical protein